MSQESSPAPIRAFQEALEDGELEHDLLVEVAGRNLDGLDDARLVLLVGSLIGMAREQAAGAVDRCLELAETALARAFDRFVPEALEEAHDLALAGMVGLNPFELLDDEDD